MSALDFLGVARRDGGPAARSPLAGVAAAAGARVQVRDGWEVAVGYAEPAVELAACRQSVAFADVSSLGKLELQAPAASLAGACRAFVPHAEAPALGTALREQHSWWCPVASERVLVLCEPALTCSLLARLRDALDGHVLDMSASFAALALVGPLARETFARFCALDLRPAAAPVGAFRPGSAARTPAFVLREAGERYTLLFGAAYAEYTWEVIADAAAHLGGRPVGLDTLAELASAESANTEPASAGTEVGADA